jgi:hypothetical protein
MPLRAGMVAVFLLRSTAMRNRWRLAIALKAFFTSVFGSAGPARGTSDR